MLIDFIFCYFIIELLANFIIEKKYCLFYYWQKISKMDQ